MDSSIDRNILKKEETFHRLNAELEVKTKELWKEMELVMKLQEEAATNKIAVLPRPSVVPREASQWAGPRLPAPGAQLASTLPRPALRLPLTGPRAASGRAADPAGRARAAAGADRPTNLPLGPTPAGGGDAGSRPNSRTEGGGANEEAAAPEDEWDSDDPVPREGRGMGDRATVRFLRAKARVLQDEYQSLHLEFKQQCSQLEGLRSALQRAEEERTRWQLQATSSRDQLAKQQQWAGAANSQLAEREAEISALRKEVDKLKKEYKQTAQQQSSADARLNRALEETDRLKAALRAAKQEEKERKDDAKKKFERMVGTVRKLERQKTELIGAFKKQLQLIDNLKKQKAHLEASRVVRFSEEEFMKMLDWRPGAPGPRLEPG